MRMPSLPVPPIPGAYKVVSTLSKVKSVLPIARLMSVTKSSQVCIFGGESYETGGAKSWVWDDSESTSDESWLVSKGDASAGFASVEGPVGEP